MNKTYPPEKIWLFGNHICETDQRHTNILMLANNNTYENQAVACFNMNKTYL